MPYMQMIHEYNKMSAAHKYIIGFLLNNIVYYATISWNELCEFLKEDHASSKRGGTLKARIRISAKLKKEYVNTGKALPLCSMDELKKGIYNKGENFERVITETLTDTVWVKDSIPFYVQGDIQVNGEEIQVKFDGAELTNEKTLMNAKNLLSK